MARTRSELTAVDPSELAKLEAYGAQHGLSVELAADEGGQYIGRLQVQTESLVGQFIGDAKLIVHRKALLGGISPPAAVSIAYTPGARRPTVTRLRPTRRGLRAWF